MSENKDESFLHFYARFWRESPVGAFIVTVIGLYALYVAFCFLELLVMEDGGTGYSDDGQQMYWP